MLSIDSAIFIDSDFDEQFFEAFNIFSKATLNFCLIKRVPEVGAM
jgi:hypothetical protein